MLYLIVGVVLVLMVVEVCFWAEKSKQIDATVLAMEEQFVESIFSAAGGKIDFLELAEIPSPNIIVKNGSRSEFAADSKVYLIVRHAQNMKIVWLDEDLGLVNRVQIECHARLVRPYFFSFLPTFIDRTVICVRYVERHADNFHLFPVTSLVTKDLIADKTIPHYEPERFVLYVSW